MDASNPDSRPPISSTLVFAAGGLVWRTRESIREILVVKRRRYGEDVTLPKGKLLPNETLEECALREVLEESGVQATLGAFADVISYPLPTGHKVVFFWNMEPNAESTISDTQEVSQSMWLSVSEALRLLTYPLEQELVRRTMEK